MIYETLHFLLPLLPEAFLTICAMCALCAGVYSRVDLRKTNADMLVWFGLCGSLVLIFLLRENTSGSDDGLFMADGYANFSRLAIFLLSAVSLSFGQSWLKYKKYVRFEYPVLFVQTSNTKQLTNSIWTIFPQYRLLFLFSNKVVIDT